MLGLPLALAAIVYFSTGGRVVGALLAVVVLILILGPLLFIAFGVALVIDEGRISYRSLQPQAVALARVRSLAVRRHSVRYYGLPQLLFLGAQGETLMEAFNVWSDNQVRSLAQKLNVPLIVV